MVTRHELTAFRGMQDCFREHPEMYGSELEDDEDELEEELHAREGAPATPEPSDASSPPPAEALPQTTQKATSEISEQSNTVQEEAHRDSRSTTASDVQTLGDEGGDLVPKSVHDASSK
jgi:intermembrane space import and assembly protein 40